METEELDNDAPIPGADTLPGEPELDVAGLLKEMVTENEERLRRIQPKAIRNFLYIHGDHYSDVNEDGDIGMLEWTQSMPLVSENYLRGLCNTWTARMLEDRPDVVAFPNDADSIDVGGAEVANALIYDMHAKHDLDDKFFEAGTIAQAHGTVYFKVVWNPDSGPPSRGAERFNPTTFQWEMVGVGEPAGDADVSLCTIFEVGTDGADDIENCKWCYFRDVIDKHDAWALLKGAGKTEAPRIIDDSTKDKEGTGANVREGVEVYEIWHRRSARIPEGLFALVVGGVVVDQRPFPYEHGELPLSVWHINKRTGSPYGTTHVSDAMPVQRRLNELVAVQTKVTRSVGRIPFVGSSALIDAMEGGEEHIPVDSIEDRREAGYIDPPAPPEMLFLEAEKLVSKLFQLFGVNETLSGKENVPAGTPARAIAHLAKLDTDKNSGAARNLGKCQRRMVRQYLKLKQQYVEETQLVSLVGADKVMQVWAFQGADLDGVDVRLEPRAGLERYRSTQAEQAGQEMQAGMVDPAAGAERMGSGLGQTGAQHQQRLALQEQAQTAMQGQPAEPMPNVDLDIAREEIGHALALARRGSDPNTVAAIRQLLMQYEQQAAMMAAQQAQQQTAPQGPPRGPK